MSMNLSFRTLKGDKFKLTALPSDTVTDLKKKVVARYEDGDFDAYRLIYKGKILENGKTLAESEVSENGFIVVMPPKRAAPPKTTPTPPAAAPATSATATPAAAGATTATPAPANPAAAPPSTTLAAADAAAAPATTPGGSTSSLVTGAEYEATVKRITEMGFPEDEVKRALRAAFNNPDRAVDYLFNGIPASAAPPAPPSTPPQTGGAATGTAGAGGATTAPNAAARPGQPFDMFGGGGGGGGGGGQLDFLRHHQPFNDMRRLIQANPSVLQSLLQQLEQSDPALLQLINANREEFMNLINEPVGGEGAGPGPNDEAMEQLARALAAGGGMQGGGAPPGQIMVTPEENEVIQRLSELGQSMGIQQMHVVQAWLACDKDENLAASYLLDHSEELRAQQAEDAAAMEAQRNNQGGNPPAGGGGTN